MSIFALLNAKRIWANTIDEKDSPSAVLCVGGVVECVGSDNEVLTHMSERCRLTGCRPHVIDLLGKYFVCPGFVDSHVHFMDGGRALNSANVSSAKSKEEFIQSLKHYIRCRNIPPWSWVLAFGYNEVVHGAEPHRTWLDDVSSNYYIVVHRVDLHSVVVSTSVLEKCGLFHREVSHPFGGRVEVDESGYPTGVLRDSAIALVRKWQSSDNSCEAEAAAAASSYLAMQGITSCFTMTSIGRDNIEEIVFLRDLDRKGALPIKLRACVRNDEIPELVSKFYNEGAQGSRHHFTCEGGKNLRLGAVKIFSDGSLGSKTAAFHDSYENDCHCGIMLGDQKELQSSVQQCLGEGLQCCVHAIGDRAVSTMIKIFSGVENHLLKTLRPRIEHCQHIYSYGTLDSMRDLSIIASCQPCHLLFDGWSAETLIGRGRMGLSYPFRSMLDHGVHVAFGSDWHVAPADVLQGIRAAVTRVPFPHPSNSETTMPAWNLGEAISVEDALRCFTSGAAYAAFLEDEVGRIQRGFCADLVVLSDDILSPRWLTGNGEALRVVLTVSNGSVVFRDPDFI